MCNIEFPHFGASYPDAHCINGYLWDMDSYENGCYTIGGDDPCPFCNTEVWLKTVLDNEEFASREEALEWVEKMREKWGAEHRGSSEIPKDLEEAAKEYEKRVIEETKCHHNALTYAEGYEDALLLIPDAFIAGAKWDREQIMKNAKDGWIDEECVIILNDGTRIDLQPDYDKKPAFEFEYAQNVQVIILPKEN